MSKQAIPAWISCSRSNRGVFTLYIRDSDAVDSGIEVNMTAEQFALMISGMVVDDVTAELRNARNLGKKRICEERTIECPLRGSNRDALKQWLIDNAQEDGWELDSYLGSQDSVKYRDGGCILRYRIKKWVDKDN